MAGEKTTSRKTLKKSKNIKSPKSRRDSSSSASGSESIRGAALLATTKLNRKQKELARIYELKCSILIRNELSYLEYVELREELGRLAALREIMACKAAGIEKQ